MRDLELWPKYDKTEKQYIVLKAPEVSVGRRLRENECQFLRGELNRLKEKSKSLSAFIY